MNYPKNFVERLIQQKEKPDSSFVCRHCMCYVKEKKKIFLMYQENIKIIKKLAELNLQFLKLKMVRKFGKIGKSSGKQRLLVFIDQQ